MLGGHGDREQPAAGERVDLLARAGRARGRAPRRRRRAPRPGAPRRDRLVGTEDRAPARPHGADAPSAVVTLIEGLRSRLVDRSLSSEPLDIQQVQGGAMLTRRRFRERVTGRAFHLARDAQAATRRAAVTDAPHGATMPLLVDRLSRHCTRRTRGPDRIPVRIEQLEYIAAVTQYGSLRRASERLHISQPALSEAVSKLERELGVTLLDRRRSGARISRQGRDLLQHMVEVLEAVDRLRTAAGDQAASSRLIRRRHRQRRDLDGAAAGRARASTTATRAPHVEILDDAAGRHPRGARRGLPRPRPGQPARRRRRRRRPARAPTCCTAARSSCCPPATRSRRTTR